MKKATLQLETLTCPSCMTKIEAALKGLEGVNKDTLSVSFNTSKAKVDFDENRLSLEAIIRRITELGYEVKKAQAKDA